jgi:hypothetical protein
MDACRARERQSVARGGESRAGCLAAVRAVLLELASRLHQVQGRIDDDDPRVQFQTRTGRS